MSDGGRERASLGMEVWKSSQKWSVQRSVVRSIAWLELFGGGGMCIEIKKDNATTNDVVGTIIRHGRRLQANSARSETARGWLQRLVRPVRRNTTDPINEQENHREKNRVSGQDEQRDINAEEICRPKAEQWQKGDGHAEHEQRGNANPLRPPEPQQRNGNGPKQHHRQPKQQNEPNAP
jgi:hypothetical protein